MSVVARPAPQAIATRPLASALRQVGGVAGDGHLGRAGIASKYRRPVRELFAGMKFGFRAGTLNPNVAREMALIANAVSPRGLQLCRVDDIGGFGAANVSEARTMAALTGNSALQKRWPLIPVLRIRDWPDARGMALKAAGRDGSGKKWVRVSVVSRSEGPFL